MTTAIRRTLAVLIFALGAPAPAVASPAMDAFSAACTANPDFFDFKVSGIASNPERLGALCGCLATAFAAYPDADLAMMTKDLDGSATTEDRIAYGDYTALEARALAALDGCAAETGPSVVTGGADMTKFDAACTKGDLMLEIMESDEVQRSALCACLSAGLAPRISTADADVLAADLDGTSTEESHSQHGSYDALAELAGGIMDGCFAELPPPGSP